MNCVWSTPVTEPALAPPKPVLSVALLVPAGDAWKLGIYSAVGGAGAGPGSWRVHLSAEVWPGDAPAAEDVAAVRARVTERLEVEELYARLAALGLQYGGAFRGLQELWRGQGEALGRVSLGPGLGQRGSFLIHPALLDACTHVCVAALPLPDGELFLPVAMQRVWLRDGGCAASEAWSHVTARACSADVMHCDVAVTDADGCLVAHLDGLALRRAPRHAFLRQLEAKHHRCLGAGGYPLPCHGQAKSGQFGLHF